MIKRIQVATGGRGLHEITSEIQRQLESAGEGLCTIFVCHTSASLTIQENADPSARRDLENWLNRLVPEGDPLYTHTMEGDDDMPSHIKSVLTQTSLAVPFTDGRLLLGTWQGVFLWEHRRGRQLRDLVLHY